MRRILVGAVLVMMVSGCKREPTYEDVCDHIIDVVMQENFGTTKPTIEHTGSEEKSRALKTAMQQMHGECVTTFESRYAEEVAQGRKRTADETLRCAMAARTIADTEACRFIR
jgi:hypothetical protein